MIKKIMALSLAATLSLTGLAIGNVAFASVNNESCEEIMLEDVMSSNDRTGRNILNQKEKMDEYRNGIEVDSARSFKRLNKKIVVPKKDVLKKDLLMHLNQNKEMNEHNISNIDNIVEEIIMYFENTQNNDLVAQDFRLYPHWHSWHITPYLKETTKWITYGTSWIGLDAYRSVIGGTKTNSESRTISYKIGISGSTEVKDYLKLSGNWEKTESNTITVSAGTTCPGWTVVWWRPYTRWEKDEYFGNYKTQYYNLEGHFCNEYRGHWTYKKRLKDDMTEIASAQNGTQNINASTPSAPTGAPNAWW